MISYEIILIAPDKKETIIGIKHKATEIPLVTERAEYAGTWLTPERKLLRFGRGEIIIREKIKYPRIVSHQDITIGNTAWYDCLVKYHEELHTIYLNEKVIVGHDQYQKVLWSVSSPAELNESLGKELTYQIIRYQEKFIAAHPVEVDIKQMTMKERLKSIISVNRTLDQ